MLIKKLALLTAAGAATLPLLANAAEDVSYTYLEASYAIADIDLFEDPGIGGFEEFRQDTKDGDGFKIDGSFGFAENFFAFVGYSSLQSDLRYYDEDLGVAYLDDQKLKTLKLGVGYAFPINDQIDLFASAAYMDIDYGDFSFGQVNDDIVDGEEDFVDELDNALGDLSDDASDGYSLDAGIRSQATPWLEVGVGARYQDLDMGDDFTAFGNAMFEITQNMGINLGAELGSDVNVYSLGFRYSFSM